MTTIHIATLGCPKNAVDSRHLAEAFTREGFQVSDDPGEADIIAVNTCGFIKDAKEESVNEVLRLAKWKTEGRSPSDPRRLVVFGCLAQRYRGELLKEIPEIDGLWGVGEFDAIVKWCKGVDGRKGTARKPARAQAAREGATASYAYLKIAEGCDRKCTFCVIPSIRGRFRSATPEAILSEARSFVEQGIKELILVAQDITTYGKEWKDYGLPELLRDLVAIEGDFLVRVLYLYPTAVTPELLELIAREPKICKYLDIPLQHSEDRILRLMGRRGTKKEYVKLLRTVRRAIPGVTLRTTFIVGFPTETEEDFRGLVDFVEEARFDRLGVFSFSKEEGTPSAKLQPQVPERTKQRRVDEIMRRQSAISLEKNRELVGSRMRVVVDEADEDAIIARSCAHTPEIDGVVIIEKEAGQTFSGIVPGRFVEVEIVDAYDYDLKARLIGKRKKQE